MRNFYLTADIDGRQTRLTGGPARKDGGMTVEIRQRDGRYSVVAFRIVCLEEDGKLITQVLNCDGGVVDELVTKR